MGVRMCGLISLLFSYGCYNDVNAVVNWHMQHHTIFLVIQSRWG